LQLALGGIDPGHVGEGGAGALLAVEPRLALAEAKDALLLPAYPPSGEPEQADQEDERQELDQVAEPHDPPRRCLVLAGNLDLVRSEEHTSELRHLVISYAVFCLKKKKNIK